MLTKADVGAASVSLAHVSATSLSPVGSSFATDWPRDEWRDNRVSRGTIMVHHFDVTPCTRSYKCGVALTLHKLLISTGVELRFAEFISWFHATLSHFRLKHTFDLDIKKDCTVCSKMRALFEIFLYTLLSLDRIKYDHEISILILS